MTIQEIHPVRGGDPEVIADLEAKIEALTDEADKLAGYHTNAREEADRLNRLAENHMLRALKLRDQIERWRRHLALEQGSPPDLVGEPVDDEGTVQTVLFARIPASHPYPIAHTYLTWGDKPQRRCNGCLRILRDATDDEIQAASSGGDVPDVRPDCPDCGDDWPSAS